MKEFLVPPVTNNGTPHFDSPYDFEGAQSILRRFPDDLMAMFASMHHNETCYADGRTFLAKSPLRRKIYVAAAMKTLGLIREEPSDNGACTLILTPGGRKRVREALAAGLIQRETA